MTLTPSNRLPEDKKIVISDHLPCYTNDADEYSDPETESYESESYDPLDEMLDIDIRNLNDPMRLSKYAEMIFCKARDDFGSIVSSNEVLTSTQNLEAPHWHETCVKWIFKIHREYEMRRDTLFEAVAYLNIVFARRKVEISDLQLLTVTCLWMAAKIEEGVVAKLDEMCEICSDNVTQQDFVRCEREVLMMLGFKLNYPTSIFFLRRLLDAIEANKEIREASKFFCELSLIYIDFLDYQPDVIALAAASLGKVCLGEYCPTRRMCLYGHVEAVDRVKQCCARMLHFAREIVATPGHYLLARYALGKSTGAICRLNLADCLVDQI